VPEEKLNYLSILFIGNDVIKLLSYEEAIKEYAAKKCRKKVYRYVMHSIIENIMLFVWILWCFWYLSAFLNMQFVVISHSQEIFTCVPDSASVIL
jgi:hypothetical protein